MKRSLQNFLRTVAATLIALLGPIGFVDAQTTGYQSPTFFGMGMGSQTGPHAASPFPASPLAGGPGAAQGDSFMDARGRPIVMQASYNQGGHYGETCPPGMGGGYGDPMAVDFGGYGQDQCGPHYFDVAIDSVFLKAENRFEKVGPFSSIGVGGTGPTAPRALDPTGQASDLEAGWRIAARYDVGALAVLEATYMGLYDFGFTQQVRSVDVAPEGRDNQLFSVFSNFGLGPTNTAFDFASFHRLDYQSDLQSAEISYRRYWVGVNPRVSGTWLAGARYVRMTEDFNFFGSSTLNGEGSFNLSTENDLVGFQFGGDAWASLRQGLRIGIESKAGIYNNRFKFNAAANVPGAANTLPAEQEGNQVAFVSEASATVVADILPSWSIRGGYQVLYVNSLVTVGNNISTNTFTVPVPALSTQGNTLLHGFHGGLEYVW